MEFKQYDIYWVDLNPAFGLEMNKVRPCVIITPNEINRNIDTIIIAPVSSKGQKLPTRLPILIEGKKSYLVMHQLRAIDKKRIKGFIGTLTYNEISKTKLVLREMLID